MPEESRFDKIRRIKAEIESQKYPLDEDAFYQRLKQPRSGAYQGLFQIEAHNVLGLNMLFSRGKFVGVLVDRTHPNPQRHEDPTTRDFHLTRLPTEREWRAIMKWMELKTKAERDDPSNYE